MARYDQQLWARGELRSSYDRGDYASDWQGSYLDSTQRYAHRGAAQTRSSDSQPEYAWGNRFRGDIPYGGYSRGRPVGSVRYATEYLNRQSCEGRGHGSSDRGYRGLGARGVQENWAQPNRGRFYYNWGGRGSEYQGYNGINGSPFEYSAGFSGSYTGRRSGPGAHGRYDREYGG